MRSIGTVSNGLKLSSITSTADVGARLALLPGRLVHLSDCRDTDGARGCDGGGMKLFLKLLIRLWEVLSADVRRGMLLFLVTCIGWSTNVSRDNDVRDALAFLIIVMALGGRSGISGISNRVASPAAKPDLLLDVLIVLICDSLRAFRGGIGGNVGDVDLDSRSDSELCIVACDFLFILVVELDRIEMTEGRTRCTLIATGLAASTITASSTSSSLSGVESSISGEVITAEKRL